MTSENTPMDAPAQESCDHGECFGGECIYAKGANTIETLRRQVAVGVAMNKHIIVEEMPHGVRSMILSAVLSCSMFFTLGFFGRDVWLDHANNVDVRLFKCVAEQTVGQPKRTLTWKIQDEPKK